MIVKHATEISKIDFRDNVVYNSMIINIQGIRELNPAVMQLLELAEEKKATRELYENFGRALEGAMRLSYETENLIKETSE